MPCILGTLASVPWHLKPLLLLPVLQERQKDVDFYILLAFGGTLCNEQKIASNEQKIAKERREKWTEAEQILVSDRKGILPNGE